MVLISHHLREVREVADTVTVLRRGRRVAHEPIHAVTNAELAGLITGDAPPADSEVPFGTPGATNLVRIAFVTREHAAKA